MAQRFRLSACVVTYNSEKHITSVLECLFASTISDQMQVFVVDNASKDGTVALVKESFPNVQVIALQENLGFGRGHNQVLPYLDSDYHLIVNPDVTFQPDVLEKMTSFLDCHREAATLTPRVLHPDGQEQFLPKELPSLHFMAGGYLERLGKPFSTWRKKYTWEISPPASPRELSFATGCFMLMRTSAYLAVKGFDPRYFLYMEDIDLARKLKTQGQTLYHPGFFVTHVWARDSARSIRGTLTMLKSMGLYFHKWGWRI